MQPAGTIRFRKVKSTHKSTHRILRRHCGRFTGGEKSAMFHLLSQPDFRFRHFNHPYHAAVTPAKRTPARTAPTP
jgi:hypothetical protein